MPALLTVIEFLADARTLGFLALLAGTALLWTGRDWLGRTVITVTVTAALVLGVLPAGAWLLGTLEGRFPAPAALPEQVDGIVVLGGEFNAAQAGPAGRYSLGEMPVPRFLALADLARRYPQARLVLSGLWGGGAPAEDLIATLGIDRARVLYEDRSRSTYEAALFSLRIAGPETGETWLIVTSAFHIPRAVGAFRRAGWAVVPFPVDYQTRGGARLQGFGFDSGLRLLAQALREYAALFVYATLGLTDSWLPSPRR